MADREVRAKLTLQDLATAQLAKIKQGFGAVAGEAKKTEKDVGGFARQMVAHFAAVNLMPAIHQVKAFGESIVEAAASEEQAITAMAGLTSAIQGIPFHQAAEGAAEIDDQLDKLGMQTGVKNLGEGFQALIDKIGGTATGVGQAREQIGQMAQISRVLGKDAGSVAAEFGMMQEGMLRTRGQLFQLLRQTGIFGDNIKGAAAAWAKLTEEQRAKALADGLGKISSRLALVPPTFKQVTGQLENAFDVAKEVLGAPLIKAVTPELQKLVTMLEEAKPDLESFAQDAAREIGGWVREGGQMIKDGFQYLKTHGAELRADIVEAFTFAKSVVTFMVREAKVLAAIWAGAKLAPAAGAAAGLVGGVAKGTAGGVTAVAGTKMGEGVAGAAGGAMAVGALTVAIGALAVTAYQAEKAIVESNESMQATKDQTQQLIDLAKAGKAEQFENLAASIAENSQNAKKSAGFFEDLGNTLFGTLEPLGMAEEQFRRLTEALREQMQVGEATAAMYEEQAAVDVTQLAESYNQAIATGQMANARYAASLLIQSGVTAATLEEAGIALEGGFNRFNELFSGAAAGTKDLVEQFFGGGKPGTVPKAAISVGGGNTINIKQDFREADPDRVALTFNRDMLRAASRRLQATTTGAFGT